MIDDNIINKPLEELLNNINYKRYLETVFPNSLIKDILYHGTYYEFEEFDNKFLTKGCKYFCFTDDIDYAKQFGNIKYVKLNIINPLKTRIKVGKSNIDILVDTYMKDNFDSIISKDIYFDGITMFKGGKTIHIREQHGITIIPFNINQIYILGTNKDKINFKNYLENDTLYQKDCGAS